MTRPALLVADVIVSSLLLLASLVIDGPAPGTRSSDCPFMDARTACPPQRPIWRITSDGCVDRSPDFTRNADQQMQPDLALGLGNLRGGN